MNKKIENNKKKKTINATMFKFYYSICYVQLKVPQRGIFITEQNCVSSSCEQNRKGIEHEKKRREI